MKKNSVSNLKNTAIGLLAFALAVFLVGLGLTLQAPSKEKQRLRCTGETIGRIRDIVKEIDTDSDGRSHTYYTYHVDYVVNDCLYHHFVTNGSSSAKEGSSINVHYNPDNPKDIYLGSSISASSAQKQKTVGIIMAWIGGAAVISCVIMLIVAKRRSKEIQISSVLEQNTDNCADHNSK